MPYVDEYIDFLSSVKFILHCLLFNMNYEKIINEKEW